ncbi:MAG: HD domain-containing protein [Myxococcota bacterium]|nr:HD domain-containing protein [Myxococcota bacterium]
MRTQPFYGAKVGEALKLAADAFATRERKGSGAPYLTHLLAVATIVMEHGGDEDQIAAAILHDYLEDIPGASEDELEAAFGGRVARIVRALSDTTDATDKAPWKPRKLSYLAHLRDADAEVKLVGAADKLHNARSIVDDHRRIGDEVFELFTASREDTLWYYREVVGALSHDFEHPLVERVRRAVRELHDATGMPIDL